MTQKFSLITLLAGIIIFAFWREKEYQINRARLIQELAFNDAREQLKRYQNGHHTTG